MKSTSTVSTPKYIETKPRKPNFKDKTKKWKPIRKKENNDNKNEEEQVVSTHLSSDLQSSIPTVTSLMTSSRPSWILLRNNSKCVTISMDKICYFVTLLVTLRVYRR